MQANTLRCAQVHCCKQTAGAVAYPLSKQRTKFLRTGQQLIKQTTHVRYCVSQEGIDKFFEAAQAATAAMEEATPLLEEATQLTKEITPLLQV